MFGFVLLGFLSICVILAVACFLAFKSGKEGTTKLGTGAGCLVALGLVFVAGLSALGCTAIAFLNAPNEVIRHGPFRRVEAHWPDLHADASEPADEPADEPAGEQAGEQAGEPRDSEGLRLRIEMDGGDPAEVTRWFREHTDEDLTVSVESVEGPAGPRTRIDIEIKIPESDLHDIRRDFQRDLPNLNLPNGLSIELKSADDQ